VIVVDNVVRQGHVVDERSDDTSVLGTRRLFAEMAQEERMTATALQTVGLKGYDGFAIAIVEASQGR
jgi:predicted O-methyltransferase YrrM